MAGMCVCGRGVCVAGKTAIAAGGTHPTGMHSCFPICFMGEDCGIDFTSHAAAFIHLQVTRNYMYEHVLCTNHAIRSFSYNEVHHTIRSCGATNLNQWRI